MDYVIISLSPFDYEFGSNIRDIAYEIAKFHRVLYVNIPLKRSEAIRNSKDSYVIKRKNVIKGKTDGLDKINDNFWVLTPDILIEPINSLPSKGIFDLLNKQNNKRYARSIKKALDGLHFENIVFINDNDFYTGYYLKKLLSPEVYVYYLRDMLTATDYWKTHGLRLEPILMAEADLVLTNSVYLKEYAMKWNQSSFYVGQGCDIDHFTTDPNDIPDDIGAISAPIIGYFGALDSNRLDIKLISALAKEKEDWNIVLIGHEDESFQNCELHSVPNIHFLGPKPFQELPKYLYSFDVCINPQLFNEFTIGNYPRKVDEYLVSGIPVVATRTKGMEPFKDFTYLADTLEGYIEAITEALNNDSAENSQARKLFASEHTWQNSVASMFNHIENHRPMKL